MDSKLKEQWEKYVSLARKTISLSQTLDTSLKGRVESYCKNIEDRLNNLTVYDIKREKWVADLNEYKQNIELVFKRIPEHERQEEETVDKMSGFVSEVKSKKDATVTPNIVNMGTATQSPRG